jgi:hypothetical protein
MRGPHVVQVVSATEFQRSNMLGNPTLTGAIDGPVTQHAHPTCSLPHLKSSMRCELTTECCTYIDHGNERHKCPD